MGRVILESDPLIRREPFSFGAAAWPASWVEPIGVNMNDAGVWTFRCQFQHAGGKQRVHVSADQRYHLYLDGNRVGRGPERSDLQHWMYNSYDLDLSPGQHTIVAIIWWCSPTCPTPPPWAQQTQRPGFLFFAEDSDQISTGKAPWDVKRLEGIAFDPDGLGVLWDEVIGWRIKVDGRQFPWGVEHGNGDGWQRAPVLQPAAVSSLMRESHPYWILHPAMLPEMSEEVVTRGIVRHVESTSDFKTRGVRVETKHHIPDESAGWNDLLSHKKSLTIPPNTCRRVVVDWEDYLCAYTELIFTAGRDAVVTIEWAESLFENDPTIGNESSYSNKKGPRSQVEGKYFNGYHDTFIADGGTNRFYESLWWKAGRYVQICVETSEEPLTIDRLAFVSTRYPYDFASRFKATDTRLEKIIPLALRTLNMCSHETSMDCPYYEQLNYTGDTRLQSLVAMVTSRDDRLVRKGIKLFDWSRTGDTWTASRYPTRRTQVIPTFALWWTTIVHDYAMYRGDLDFVRSCMPGVRAIIERWRLQIDSKGLLTLPEGWNFVDWVSGWRGGVSNPLPGDHCAITQWQFVYTLNLMSKLEAILNEPLLAQRHAQTAAMLAATAERAFYSPERKLFADDEGKTRFSEHAQVMALISGHLSAHLVPQIADGLINDANIAKTTIYFDHYTFEAYRTIGRVDRLIERMKTWFDHESLGLCTLMEQPEPSRSDCHAWGAHPVFHFYSTLLGIRPAAPGFRQVLIIPQIGQMECVEGEMVHPKGTIKASIRQSAGNLNGQIELPAGVTGSLICNDVSLPLISGLTKF